MRASLAIVTLLLAPLSVAHSADIDVAEPLPAWSAPNVYTWSGPYAGGFVGYNFANFDQPGSASNDAEGLVGGVYAGYNLQTDRLVYGVEGDVGASDVSVSGFDPANGVPFQSDAGAFGSLRARVGFAYDPVLVFATGGVAAARSELSLGEAEDSNTHFGYTVGAGVEAQVTPSVSTRLEYRYSDFGSRDYDLGDVTVSSGFDEHSIRAGLALKF